MNWREKSKERNDTKQTVQEITKQLEDGIKDLFESEKFKKYLQVMSKFHNYSLYNNMLIAYQRPDASLVCGYVGWGKFNRYVKKGSKGIMILAPNPKKKMVEEIVRDENGNPKKDKDGNVITQEVERKYMSFRKEYVYDVSDTYGEDLPTIPISILDKTVQDFEELKSILQTISPVPIHYEELLDTDANGYYDLQSQSIYVKSTLPELQQIKTTIHEIAHSILHDRSWGEDLESNKREKEVTVEAIAYTVCNYLGLDTQDYSFGYISGWSEGKELKELREKLEIIRKTSNTIIDKLEEEIKKREMKESENLALYNNTGFLTFEKNEDGYSWQLFDINHGLVFDGEIKNPSLTMNEAVSEVMDLIGSNESVWELYDYNRIKQKAQEQVHNINDENKKLSEQKMEQDNVKKSNHRKRG